MLLFHQIQEKSKGSVKREITINVWVDLYFLKRKSKTWHHKGMQLEGEKSRDQHEKKS